MMGCSNKRKEKKEERERKNKENKKVDKFTTKRKEIERRKTDLTKNYLALKHHSWQLSKEGGEKNQKPKN